MSNKKDGNHPVQLRPAAPVSAPAAVVAAEPTESIRAFFKPEDWLAALATTLISGGFFLYFMAPEVTLQDSGELVTGAFTFGVPHPPGYPLWAFLGFVWSHLVVPFGNPAWRIGTLSAVTGALTVGLLTITMTRSLRLLLHSLPWARAEDEKLYHWMAITLGASTALLFGFNRGVWLWSCVSEMRVLNQFSFVLMTCMFLAWMVQPRRRGFLYVTLLLYALSFANHQTVAVMAIPFAVGALVVGLERYYAQRAANPGRPFWQTLMPCLDTFWELSSAGLLALMVGLSVVSWLLPDAEVARKHKLLTVGLAFGGLGVAGLVVGFATRWWRVRRALACAGLFLAGASFYLYMPLAASTNPPMNWGYAATKEGFLHAVSRGQYEKVAMAHVFSGDFLLKIRVFAHGLVNQYSLPLCLFAAVTLACVLWAFWRRYRGRLPRMAFILVSTLAIGLPLLLLLKHALKETGPLWIVLLWDACLAAGVAGTLGAWRFFRPGGRAWMVFLFTAFLCASLILLIIINPKVDKQEQEITIKFFAPAHGFYGMLIGYGIAVLLSLAAARWRQAATAAAVRAACVVLLGLPAITFARNWSLCNLHGHDFGYLFGYLMFEPGGGYAPMDRDAVLYGGTDPGRFVPTYMIFCESRVKPQDRFRNRDFDRSDVYIITQNALADSTYMSYIRDHYDFTRPDADKPETIAGFTALRRGVFERGWTLLGRNRTYPKAPIHIPSPEDTNRAFQEYIQGIQNGTIAPNADVKIENGRVSVQGVGGVMAINGILARWIFDKNKDKHAFYVEESYVIPWMYDFLTPYGVIMKIEKEPVPPPQQDPARWQQIVARDKAYWDKLSSNFLGRADFRRNADAKKSFSKMRSAIAGLFESRGLIPEAEYAYRQSLALCPESPEGSFRLANLYMRLRRYGDARKLLEDYCKVDVYNHSARDFLNNIRSVERDEIRRVEITKKWQNGQLDLNTAIELNRIYLHLGLEGEYQNLTRSLLEGSNMPAQVALQVATIAGEGRRWDVVGQALRRYLAAAPGDYARWIDLAAVELNQNRAQETIDALARAVQIGGEGARAALRADRRFDGVRAQPAFRELVQSQSRLAIPSLPF
jgi:tetratricopeptide (TPR) repeat protein